MSKSEYYRQQLATLQEWEPYLRQESALPGPRGNLELASAVAEVGRLVQFEAWLSADAAKPEADTPEMYLAFCGVVGLGACIARSLCGEETTKPADTDHLWQVLRAYASDPRWRMREAVAMALQRIGDASMEALYRGIDSWRIGNWLEKRAVAAGLAEPRLLTHERDIQRSLSIIDEITASLASAANRSGDDFRILRQCLGYAWSVIVAASPEKGAPYMERWLDSPDPDIRWILKENLKKKRLAGIFTAR